MKITFGAIMTEGTGKLGGHAAQRSRAGAILRTIRQPKKASAVSQSYNKQNLQLVSGGWKNLSEEQRLTWNNNAPIGKSGFDLYMSVNLRLIGVNLPLLSEYTLGDQWFIKYPLYRFNDNGTFSPEYSQYAWTINNYFGLFPVTGWTKRFVWTGWIPVSKYRYPPINKSLKATYESASNVAIQLTWVQDEYTIDLAYGEEGKAKVSLEYINNESGEIFSAGTFEIRPNDSGFSPLPYMPETAVGDTTLTSVPGGYRVTSIIASNNSTFDFDEWVPWWFISEWHPFDYEGQLIADQPIGQSRFTFNSSSQITLVLNPADIPNQTPPEPGYTALVAIGWKNINTGETVSESGTQFYLE